MKKVLKILLVILLLGALGFEVYMYFFKQDKDISYKEKEKSTKLETKYLADIYTGYKLNGITTEQINDGKLYYHKISGLKDQKTQENINNRIKSKAEELSKLAKENEYVISGITSNFENTMSMVFCVKEKSLIEDSDKEQYCGEYDATDTLNIDLTTGNDVTIYDIVNSKDALKERVNELGYGSLMRDIGIVCGGGPCTNPDPDYSTVEEDLLSLMIKFNNDDFAFSYNPEYLFIKFKNVNITKPEMCHDDSTKECKKYKIKYIGTMYINQNKKVSEYQLIIPFTSIFDNLTIYDKFKTKSSIFEKEGEEVSIKMSRPDDYSSPQMIESDNSLIDYNIFYYQGDEEVNISESIKNSLFNEMKALKSKNFNIYDVFGLTDVIFGADDKHYDYIYFDVVHYDMPKSVYEKNREKIYKDKYNKVSTLEGGYTYKYHEENNTIEYGYDFLKEYVDRTAFFYYVYDENGKELDNDDFISYDYLKSVIPSTWLSLGNYKNLDEMIDDGLVMLTDNHKFPNKLVIIDEGIKISLRYKNKKKVLNNDYDDYDQIAEKLYK